MTQPPDFANIPGPFGEWERSMPPAPSGDAAIDPHIRVAVGPGLVGLVLDVITEDNLDCYGQLSLASNKLIGYSAFMLCLRAKGADVNAIYPDGLEAPYFPATTIDDAVELPKEFQNTPALRFRLSPRSMAAVSLNAELEPQMSREDTVRQLMIEGGAIWRHCTQRGYYSVKMDDRNHLAKIYTEPE